MQTNNKRFTFVLEQTKEPRLKRKKYFSNHPNPTLNHHANNSRENL